MDTHPGEERAQRRVTPLWLWPSASAVISVALTAALTRLQLPDAVATLIWPGGTDAAATMVQIVGGSVITVTSLTFSLTVLALQLASQQFSPRLLREFSRDPVTRVLLSVLIATFMSCLTVIRTLRTDGEVPAAAILTVLLLGVASLAALLAFITHIVDILRVDSMMRAVHDETVKAIDHFYPPADDPGGAWPLPSPPPQATVLRAPRGGFLQRTDPEALVAAAREADAVVHLLARPGDHVVSGTPIAVTWLRDGSGGEVPEQARDAFVRAVTLGFERTLDQDASFGFRQLEDIAVKALSPGINDPVTAAHAIGHMSELLVRLTRCRVGPTFHQDDEGVGRALVPDRDVAYYLDLTCGQVRRFGRREPTVLIALLRMLRDVVAVTPDETFHAEVLRQADRVVEAAEGLLDVEQEAVDDMRRRVHLAVRGELVESYGDRAGETRSI